MIDSTTNSGSNAPVVVLVEDDPDHAELMRRSLAKAGLNTEMLHLSDGQLALDYLLGDEQPEELPKLILLDLNLPKVDGWQVLAKLKRSSYATVPVVILTSSSNPDDIARSAQLHANSYVSKPARLQGYIELASALSSYWLCWNRLAPVPT